MAMYQPMAKSSRLTLLALAALAAVALVLFARGPAAPQGFVAGAPGALRGPQAVAAGAASRLPLRAASQEVDAEVVGEDDDDDEEDEEVAEEDAEEEQEEVSDKNRIDRHKVNQLFFDMYKKPKSFFPHKLQPGDTLRVYYMQPVPTGDDEKRDYKTYDPNAMKETFFDGIIMRFKGELHARTVTLRAMVGKGEDAMGVEINFPVHSPLVTRMQVLRRGYIGRNKNAWFMRGMVGKRNAIPLDKERAQMDELYASLREEGREDEIPVPEYPQQAWDRYPLPIWKQDMDDWEEENYRPEDVDTRSDYEVRVIDKYKKRISRTGKYGTVYRR